MGLIFRVGLFVCFLLGFCNLYGVEIKDTTRLDSISSDTIKYWKTGGCLTLNLSQVMLSNWSAGGQNSVAANAILSLTANYSKDNSVWDNMFDFGFGRLKRENIKAIKTDDRIDFSTKYGRRIANKWFYSTLLNFK